MHLAINALSLLNPLTGIGKYTYSLASEFSKVDRDLNVEYFYSFSYSRHLVNARINTGVVDLKQKFPGLKPYARKIRDFCSRLHKKQFDVYFEPNFIPINIPAKRRIVTVADFSFVTHPECHPKERMDYFNSQFWPRIKTADHIIFISDFIRRYAIEEFNFSEQHSTTIPLGVLHSQFHKMSDQEIGDLRERMNLPERFMLFVGSLEPRKNLERVLAAYTTLPQSIRKEFKMVLVGAAGWNNDRIQQIINEHPHEIIRLGYLSDEDLPRIYNLASLFVFTSLYEGFGLPALEAMACGCPVLSSNVTSLPEVCGNAAELVNPADQEAIRDGMLKILTDSEKASHLAARGLERAQQFTWEKCAIEHLKVFRGDV